MVRWDPHPFPGWLSVEVDDGLGQRHWIHEKAPVLTNLLVDSATILPIELWLAGEHVRIEAGLAVVRLAHGVLTDEDCSELTMAPDDVRWL